MFLRATGGRRYLHNLSNLSGVSEVRSGLQVGGDTLTYLTLVWVLLRHARSMPVPVGSRGTVVACGQQLRQAAVGGDRCKEGPAPSSEASSRRLKDRTSCASLLSYADK